MFKSCLLHRHQQCQLTLLAETVWVLTVVTNHYSYNSCDGLKKIVNIMFPEHQVVQNFSCGADKASYITSFGLGPHFQSLINKRINASDGYVLMFDESLNKELGSKQLDLHMRYWDGDQVSKFLNLIQ